MSRMLLDPLALGILAGTVLSFLLWPTRLGSGSILAALFVILFSAEVACFDGQRHVTPKFDASFFVWGRAVELRALGGLAIMLVGAPCGAVIGKLARARHGAIMGLIAMCPFGLGLFASSVQLQLSVRHLLDIETPERRIELLQTAINQSTTLLASGTITSMVTCITVAIALARMSD